jgi:hypothetical protein
MLRIRRRQAKNMNKETYRTIQYIRGIAAQIQNALKDDIILLKLSNLVLFIIFCAELSSIIKQISK